MPPVKERLPAAPMVFQTGDIPDGINEYRDTLGHTIGDRPEGWNWISGQALGSGAVSFIRCRTAGPGPARSETYGALVRREFRKFTAGMIGLVLVTFLLLTAIYADVLSPVSPEQSNQPYSEPTHVTFYTNKGGWGAAAPCKPGG